MSHRALALPTLLHPSRPASIWLCALAIAALAPSASAQTTIQWAAPASGDWWTDTNWNPLNIPNTFAEYAVLGLAGPYTASISEAASTSVGSLTISNPQAVLTVAGSSGTWTTDLRIYAAGIANQGTIRLLAGTGTGDARIYFVQGATLSGAGQIRLEEPADAQIALGSSLVINASGHTISGTGLITAGGAGGTLRNLGTLRADAPGLVLDVDSTINDALIIASGGGILHPTNITQSSTAVVRADGGTVILGGGLISGGSIESLGVGKVEVPPGSAGTLNGVEIRGDLYIQGPTGADHTDLLVASGGIYNNGSVHLAAGPGTGDARLKFASHTGLEGSGRILLEDPVDARLNLGGYQVTNSASHTISGTGVIEKGEYAGALINLGVISADVANLPLTIERANNSGLIQAISGAILRPENVTQTSTGIIRATGATIVMDPSHISGGTVDATQGIISAGSAHFDGVTLLGDVAVKEQNSSIIGAVSVGPGGLIHTGTIFLYPSDDGSRCVLDLARNSTISGPGRVVGTNILQSEIYTPFKEGLAFNAPGHLITGSLRFRNYDLTGLLTNDGTIAPGDPIGQMTMQYLAQGPLGILEIELAGPDPLQRDSILVSGNLALDGTLRVRFRDGYLLPPCGECLAIAGPVTGSFAHVDAPTMPAGALSLRYGPEGVTIAYYPSDIDHSGFVDTEDFTAFVLAFEAGTDDADFDHSGFVDFEDFIAFVTAFESGC